MRGTSARGRDSTQVDQELQGREQLAELFGAVGVLGGVGLDVERLARLELLGDLLEQIGAGHNRLASPLPLGLEGDDGRSYREIEASGEGQ